MPIVSFETNDTLIFKKKHPCSSSEFKVLRVGADIKILCKGCGREMMLPREKIEKMIKSVIHCDKEI